MAISSSSSASRAASLAPGFRFHPTDEELVRYYLRRKICGKPFRFDAISVIDIYKVEPWDLPGKSRLRSRDLEWYFFSVLDRKYGNASRTNRATERGYWKTTGKDRAVWHRSKVVGMKKTLVYHSGRAPRGDRTNWVMHEYRLVDEDLEKRGILQDALVLCRVFQKSGSGPKNGEQYGAPFIEEEWEDDEFEIFPEEALAEEVVVSNGACLDISDLEQILGTSIPSGGAPLPLNLSPGDNISFSENQSEQPDKPDSLNMPMQNNMVAKSLEYQNNVEPRNDNIGDVDFLLDEPFLDSTDNYDNKGFLEASDDMLEEYLAFFDADDGTSQHMAFDLSDMIGNDNFIPEEPLFAPEIMNGGAQLLSMPSNQLLGGRVDDVTSSSKQEPVKFESESQYQIVKRANQMLKSIPAPPAFASEFPAKDAALRLNSAFRSSLIAASLVQIRNTTSSVKTKWPLGKRRDVNIVLSFGMSRSGGSSGIWGSTVGLLSGMAGSAISRALFYFLFLWVLILSVSFKIGSFVCAR